MQRFTISLDDGLAAQFDELISAKGYVNRSEAVRDLIRERLGSHAISGDVGKSGSGKLTAAKGTRNARWCVASVSYVYDHHEHTVTERVLGLQHDHHDLVITSLHTHLDHHHCLETVVLRGPLDSVKGCADQLVALRGVRNGNVHIVPLEEDSRAHRHDTAHSHGSGHSHKHFRPMT